MAPCRPACSSRRNRTTTRPVRCLKTVRSLLWLLEEFPECSEIASEVCCALVKIASVAAGNLLAVLMACRAGNILVGVIAHFQEDAQVMADAAIALGVLGGMIRVVELMCMAPKDHAMQLAGCKAFTEIRRMGLDFVDGKERQAAVAAVQRALEARPEWHLQAQLAMGLLAEPPRG